MIPARGGSKSISFKNIIKLNKKPLIEWTFLSLNKSKLIDYTILSTDNKKIKEVADKNKIETPFLRPKELSKDNTPMIDVARHSLNWFKSKFSYYPEYLIIAQPTSPFRDHEDIDKCINIIKKNKNIDTVVSITKVPHNFTPLSLMYKSLKFLKPYKKMNERKNLKQLKGNFFARNGAIYLSKTKTILDSKTFYGKNIYGYEMNEIKSIDIDNIEDLKKAEVFMKTNFKY